MKTKFLLPHFCKWMGCGILALGIFTFFLTDFLAKILSFDVSKILYFSKFGIGTTQDFSYTLQILLIVVGGLMLMFSREKVEDEFTMNVRLKSLMYSVLANYIIVLLTDIFLYGEYFLYVMCYNFYTIIILYAVIFHILLFKNSKTNAE